MITRLIDPNATLDYGWDWPRWLEDGDTIESSTWIVLPVLPV